ncbi:hypothetical protein FRC02_005320 [Tulasnella sp. 418]|nr:hypothetical protein FRC02_005320 [Tulasnella sp. 418]
MRQPTGYQLILRLQRNKAAVFSTMASVYYREIPSNSILLFFRIATMKVMQVVSILCLLLAKVDARPTSTHALSPNEAKRDISGDTSGALTSSVPSQSISEAPSAYGVAPTSASVNFIQLQQFSTSTQLSSSSNAGEDVAVAQIQTLTSSPTSTTAIITTSSASSATASGLASSQPTTIFLLGLPHSLSSTTPISTASTITSYASSTKVLSSSRFITTPSSRPTTKQEANAKSQKGLDRSLLLTFIVLGIMIALTIMILVAVKVQRCLRHRRSRERSSDKARCRSPTGSFRSSMDFHDGPEKAEWSMTEGSGCGGSTNLTSNCAWDNYNLASLSGPSNIIPGPPPTMDIGGRRYQNQLGGNINRVHNTYYPHVNPTTPPIVSISASTSSRGLGDALAVSDRPTYLAHSPITTVFDKNTNSYHIVEDPFAYRRREYR